MMDRQIDAFLCLDALDQYRGRPLRMPTTREELAALHTHLAWICIAKYLGCAGPDEERVLAWEHTHQVELEALKRRFLTDATE